MQSRPLLIVPIAILLLVPGAIHGQAGGPPGRVSLAGWAGGFVNMGGFSEGDSFFQFDEGSGIFDDFAFGGSLHYAFSGEFSLGVEGVLANPDYTRFDRDDGSTLGRGSASLYGIMANARLVGAPGQITFVLTGGAGFVSWDIDEIESPDRDLALDFGLGLEYRVRPRVALFGGYDWWWVYHQKDERIASNTFRTSLLRGGLRVILF